MKYALGKFVKYNVKAAHLRLIFKILKFKRVEILKSFKEEFSIWSRNSEHENFFHD